MKAIALTSETFDSTLAGTSLPVLVDFHAEWCGPCKMLGPIVEQVAEATAGQAVVAKVDIDAARDIAPGFRITSVPTLMVFKDGQPVVESRGVQTKAAIESMIARAAATTEASGYRSLERVDGRHVIPLFHGGCKFPALCDV